MLATMKTSFILFVTLSGCVIYCTAQMGGSGGWGGAPGAPGAPGSPGAPGAPGYPSDYGYGFGGVDSRGNAYGGSGGNGGYFVSRTDDQGRTHTYSGAGGAGGLPGQPGFPGQPGMPGGPPPYGGYGSYGSAYGNAYARASATSAYRQSANWAICTIASFLLFLKAVTLHF